MTKVGIAAVISGLMLSTAFAQVTPPAPPAPTANNVPGIARYDANPGRQQATDVGAQCGTGAGSGAFGYLGTDSSMAGGADGIQTGLNNSAVCGNR